MSKYTGRLALIALLLTTILFVSGCSSIDLTIDPDTYDSFLIFVSDTQVSGDAGDMDAVCQADANNPNQDLYWAALVGMSDRHMSGDDWVLLPEITYKRADGRTIGTTNADAIFGFFLQGQLAEPQQLWTGLTDTGALADNCNGWSTTTGTGAVGIASSLHEALFYFETRSCTNQLSIICVQVEAPPCDNGVQDGDETDVDCGGVCGECLAGKRCVVNSDCETQTCDGVCEPKSAESKATYDDSDTDDYAKTVSSSREDESIDEPLSIEERVSEDEPVSDGGFNRWKWRETGEDDTATVPLAVDEAEIAQVVQGEDANAGDVQKPHVAIVEDPVAEVTEDSKTKKSGWPLILLGIVLIGAVAIQVFYMRHKNKV